MTKSKASVKKQLTYKQAVRKIIKRPKFARKVHKLVCEARCGDIEAAAKLEAMFTLTDADIEQCCLPANIVDLLNCGRNKAFRPMRTNTTTLLYDFAAMVS